MSSFREYVDWIYQAKGAPYVWWLSGPVSAGDGPPAWAVNEPLPDISEITGGFCVAVYNLACRYFGVKIPPSSAGEDYDGGVVSTWEYWYDSSMWYSDRRSQGFQDGDLLIAPYQDGYLQGHVAMICHYEGTPYVLEWITSGGLVWDYTPDQSNEWGQYQVVIPMSQWLGQEDKKPDSDKKYPGDTANPDVVARWMARVAYEDYSLPPVLPVMCSYCELTAAWTSPGNVRNVPGYSSAQDWDSLGYFQQRPSAGWGTPEQIMDADYALRKFCQVAYDNSGGSWNKDLTDPDALGQWCQAVQRSGVPDAYRDKGYAPAMKLIEGWDKGGDVPDPKPPTPTPDLDWIDAHVLEQIKKYGFEYWADDNKWDMTYCPPPGKTSPIPASEWHKAVQEVQYREVDGKIEVKEPDGATMRMTKADFEKFFKVEDK